MRAARILIAIGRLKSDLPRAQSELDVLGRRLQVEHAQFDRGWSAMAAPLTDEVVKDVRDGIVMLLGAIGLVILLVSASIASMMLSHAASRQSEISVRLALGASRARLMRQLITESLLLALTGGAIGCVLGYWGLDLIKRFGPASIPRLAEAGIDTSVLAFTFTISVLMGLGFGLEPALRAGRLEIGEDLKAGGRTVTRQFGMRDILVVSEVTVSVVLLIGAGLLVRSLVRLESVDPGFQVNNVLSTRMALPGSKYSDGVGAKVTAFWHDAIRNIEAIPGVESAAVTSELPLSGLNNPTPRTATAPGGEPHHVYLRSVSPGYWSVMRIPLRAGRFLSPGDRKTTQRVVVINEQFRKDVFGDKDPIGQRLTFDFQERMETEYYQAVVVGVTGDIRHTSVAAPPFREAYLPLDQSPLFNYDLVVRTAISPQSVAGDLRKAIWSLDPDESVGTLRTLDEVLDLEPLMPTFAGSVPAISPIPPAEAGVGVAPAIPRSSRLSLSVLMIAGWTVGLTLSLLPMIMGLWQVRSLGRYGLPWPHARSVVEGLALDVGIHRRVEVLLHEKVAGPMTYGVVHPVIVLSPDAETWGAEDLNRAALHELEHVRRGDWLTHCLARAVCAVYWFHPLVWIAWRQLALEAERSCDDAVLGRSEATAYADQLVELARRLVLAAKSPALAMANRADLVTRVSAVLDSRQRRGRVGAFAMALACGAAVVLVVTLSPLRMVAAPQAASAQTAPHNSPSTRVQSPAAAAPEFDAVSVKLVDANVQGEHTHEKSFDPGRFSMSATMHSFVVRANGVTEGQLSGEPDWLRSRLYSIEAVTSAPASPDQMTLMLRAVLVDRFQLKLREEYRDLPVLALEVAAGGPKFRELKPSEVPKDGKEAEGTFARSFTSIDDLMNSLNGVTGGRLKLDRPVVDRTHLTGHYYIQLRTEVEIQRDDHGLTTFQFPSLFHDMQSELGLKLVPDHVRMPYFVVEQAAAPTPN